MKSFKAWDKRPIEDWGTYMSDEAKSFVRAFKNYLKRSLPGCELIGFKPNHYDTSGFVKRGDKYIYRWPTSVSPVAWAAFSTEQPSMSRTILEGPIDSRRSTILLITSMRCSTEWKGGCAHEKQAA